MTEESCPRGQCIFEEAAGDSSSETPAVTDEWPPLESGNLRTPATAWTTQISAGMVNRLLAAQLAPLHGSVQPRGAGNENDSPHEPPTPTPTAATAPLTRQDIEDANDPEQPRVARRDIAGLYYPLATDGSPGPGEEPAEGEDPIDFTTFACDPFLYGPWADPTASDYDRRKDPKWGTISQGIRVDSESTLRPSDRLGQPKNSDGSIDRWLRISASGTYFYFPEGGPGIVDHHSQGITVSVGCIRKLGITLDGILGVALVARRLQHMLVLWDGHDPTMAAILFSHWASRCKAGFIGNLLHMLNGNGGGGGKGACSPRRPNVHAGSVQPHAV